MDGDTIDKSVLCACDCQYSLNGKCTRESINMYWYFEDEINTEIVVCSNYVRKEG